MVGAATHLYEELFEKSNTPRCITSVDDYLLFANDRFRKIVGISSKEIAAGQIKLNSLFQYLPLEDYFQDLSLFIENIGGAEGKVVVTSKDGRKTKLDFVRSKVKDEGIILIAYDLTDVTEKVDFRKKLESSNERLETAADVGKLGIWEYEFESKTWLLNQRMREIFGLDITGFTDDASGFTHRIHPDDFEALTETWIDARENNKSFRSDIRVLHPTKGERNVTVSGRLIKSLHGNPYRFVGSASDFTFQKRREIEVMRDRNRLHSLVDSQSNYLIRIGQHGEITFSNQQFRKIFSDAFQSNTEPVFETLIHKSDIEPFKHVLKACIESPNHHFTLLTGLNTKLDYRIATEWEFTGISGVDGYVSEIQGFGRDISEKIQLKSKIEEAYGNIESLVNNLNNASILSLDENFRLSACNKYFLEMFSKLNGQSITIGDYMLDRVRPERRELWKNLFDSCMVNGPIDTLYEVEQSHFEISINPIRVGSKTIGLTVFVRDVSEAVELEKQLKYSQDIFKFAVEGNNYSVWNLDRSTGKIEFSDIFFDMLGYAKSQFSKDVGIFGELVHPDDALQVGQTFERMVKGELKEFSAEFRMKNSTGNYIWMANRGRIFEFDENDSPKRIVGVITDINERKETENKLKDYLSKLQRFAFLTSHNLRHPVANIIGLSNLIDTEIELSEPVQKLLHQIKTSTSHLDIVVKEMTDAISFMPPEVQLQPVAELENVWCIDDDEINNMLSERLIKRVLPEASIASFLRAEEALSMIKDNPSEAPDAIFLDINMPTMSGWEFLDALNSLNVKVSIFMLTSSIDPRDQEKAASYEIVQDFISKPLREDRLKMIIN